MELDNNTYSKLVDEIRHLVSNARQRIVYNVNTELLYTYWNIGRMIVSKEHDKQYDEPSVKQLLISLSKDLTQELGKGFSRSQLTYMRLFYLHFRTFSEETMSHQYENLIESTGVTVSHLDENKTKPIDLTVSSQLSWSHYYELLKCNSDEEISFYQQSAIHEKWSLRELRRQIDSALFERIALSKDAKGVMELGKGFAFVGRQYRIILDNTAFYVDLVFYHRILKCFVLIDLKVRSVKHGDIGQMNLYLNYFETEENVEGDNPPIGIILSRQKDDIIIEYATRGISNKIFVSKYQLYLPDKQALQNKLKELLNN